MKFEFKNLLKMVKFTNVGKKNWDLNVWWIICLSKQNLIKKQTTIADKNYISGKKKFRAERMMNSLFIYTKQNQKASNSSK